MLDVCVLVDVLQMIGRAGRPQFVCMCECHAGYMCPCRRPADDGPGGTATVCVYCYMYV